MYRLYQNAILVTLFMISCFLLISCGSQKQKFPERNIDVDSDIYIIPIGDVDEKYLYPLVPILEKRFTTKVYLALDRRMPSPDYAYDPDTNQYVAMYILAEVAKLTVPDNAKILGVTNVDLSSPGSDRSFIFGQAHFSKNSKGAIISTLRMDPKSYVNGKPNDELLIQRMTKEAVHELGHAFGLRDSGETQCAMYMPKTLKELDKKTDSFCLESQGAFQDLKRQREKEAKSKTDK